MGRVLKLTRQNGAMAALLDRVPHNDYWNSLLGEHRCHEDCPACAWKKLLDGSPKDLPAQEQKQDE